MVATLPMRTTPRHPGPTRQTPAAGERARRALPPTAEPRGVPANQAQEHNGFAHGPTRPATLPTSTPLRPPQPCDGTVPPQRFVAAARANVGKFLWGRSTTLFARELRNPPPGAPETVSGLTTLLSVVPGEESGYPARGLLSCPELSRGTFYRDQFIHWLSLRARQDWAGAEQARQGLKAPEAGMNCTDFVFLALLEAGVLDADTLCALFGVFDQTTHDPGARYRALGLDDAQPLPLGQQADPGDILFVLRPNASGSKGRAAEPLHVCIYAGEDDHGEPMAIGLYDVPLQADGRPNLHVQHHSLRALVEADQYRQRSYLRLARVPLKTAVAAIERTVARLGALAEPPEGLPVAIRDRLHLF